jgi:hypothetical protein
MRLGFHRPRRSGRLTVPGVAAVALVLSAAAIAVAAVPSTGGVISACKKPDGSIRVIDREAGQACSGSQQLVEWNQQGPAGPQGPADPAAAEFVDRFGTGTGGAASASGAPCTVGQVLLSASPVKTAGGVPADGRLLSVSQHAQLFTLLGDTYGGDGKSTFAVPDLRAITPDHMTYSICADGVWPQS